MRVRGLLGWAVLIAPLAACSSADGDADGLGTPSDAGIEAFAPDAQDDAVEDPLIQPDALVETGPEETGAEAALPDADPNLPPDCNVDVYHQYSCCVFQGVNEFRQQNGVGLLDYVWDPPTANVAQWYTEQMRDLGIFAHGVDGRKCGSRLSYFGVDWSSCGENLARNTYDDWQESCASVVVQWANSTAGHREAMLEDKWTYAGVGVAEGGGWWWTTMNFREP